MNNIAGRNISKPNSRHNSHYKTHSHFPLSPSSLSNPNFHTLHQTLILHPQFNGEICHPKRHFYFAGKSVSWFFIRSAWYRSSSSRSQTQWKQIHVWFLLVFFFNITVYVLSLVLDLWFSVVDLLFCLILD